MTVPSEAGLQSVGSVNVDHHVRFLWFLLLLGVAMLWLPPLRSSLWLDEAFTYWSVKDGLLTSLGRAHRVAHFGLYFAIVWLTTAIAGMAEWVLRLPSFVGASLALWALVRLGCRLADRETGLLAAIVFATLGAVSFAATDARPYALGLMSVIGAMNFEVAWFETGHRSHAIAFALLASAALHFQKLFVGMFLVFVYYAWSHRREARGRSLRDLAIAGSAMVLCLLPLVPDTLSLIPQSASLSWSAPPSLQTLALMSLPPMLVTGILAGLYLARRLEPDCRIEWTATESGHTGFYVAWILLPPGFLLVLSLLSPANVFNARYGLSAVPGVALLAARFVRAIEPARARRIVVQTVVFLSVATQFGIRHENEDWKQAVAAASQGSPPVLARIGTIEANSAAWLSDPEKRSYLLAPLTYYGIDERRAVPLPWTVERADQVAYVENAISEALSRADRFVLVNRRFGDLGATSAWMRGRLFPQGFCARSLGNFGFVEVLEFAKDHDNCPDERSQ
jgi:hypothetical protein